MKQQLQRLYVGMDFPTRSAWSPGPGQRRACFLMRRSATQVRMTSQITSHGASITIPSGWRARRAPCSLR